MPHFIPETAVSRYAAAPSPTTVSAAVSLHNNIRDILGARYETFLQGSYKNDTGVVDINDVDIVAIRRNTTSTVFTGIIPTSTVSWETIFQEIRQILEASHHYRNKTELGDKCITINTNFKADVVPAVYIDSGGADPISVYSFRERAERKNYPRVHYQNNVDKHGCTFGAYKPTVRMFKRWVKNWFEGTKVAPSFYVECLVYNVPDQYFRSDRAEGFFMVGDYIIKQYTKYSVINSVAGDKDVLTEQEWKPANFDVFRTQLDNSLGNVAQALRATSVSEAQHLWRKAFNE